MGGRVLVVRLERVGERLDGGDERPLEPLVARGIGDRELRLLREAAEQRELALAEVVPLDERDEAACAAVDVERRDRVAAAGRRRRLADQRLVVVEARRRTGRGSTSQGVDRQGCAASFCGRLRRMSVLGLQSLSSTVRLEVEGRVAAAEDLRGELGDPRRDVVELDERRELPAELEQRRRALGLAPRRLVQARVLDCDRRVAGEHLQQPHVVLVELVQPELRDDDHADDAASVAKRHREQRLLDRVGAFDQLPELAVRGVGDDDRLAELGAAAGDSFADALAEDVERERRPFPR